MSNSKKTVEVEIADYRIPQCPPAAYVQVNNELVQVFGRITAAHAFAAVLREYVDVEVVEIRRLN